MPPVRQGPGDANEIGSLVIAMAVILVLSGLALAIMARTLSALGSARVAQDAASAISSADAGIADALYVLDHTATPGSTLTGSAGSATWMATLTDTLGHGLDTAAVTSTGHSGTVSRTVQAMLTRPARWPWLIATTGSLVLDGADVVSPATARVAAGGSLVVRDAAVAGAGQDLLGSGASCSGCTAPNVLTANTALPDPVVPSSPMPGPPPGGCTTPISSLTAGVYYCPGNISFAAGPVTVAGQVELYVGTGTGPPVSVTFTGSQVNTGGTPTDLVVHVVGAGLIEPGDAVSAAGSFTGVIDAPRSSLRSADCQLSLIGAANLGSFDCVTGASGPGPTLTYDPSVAAVPSPTWQAGPYQDVGS